jgi:hypothetical protein
LHFLIYIAGAEIIPLFILYKVAIDYLIWFLSNFLLLIFNFLNKKTNFAVILHEF